MSKKSRRSRSKYQAKTTRVSEGGHSQQPNLVTQDTIKSVAAESKMPTGTTARSQYPVANYSYVTRDIRYIGILAGSMIVILIILSFILG